jgi:hypothetical protein
MELEPTGIRPAEPAEASRRWQREADGMAPVAVLRALLQPRQLATVAAILVLIATVAGEPAR